MAKKNRCPICDSAGEAGAARYCPVHRQELLAECERYVADWAASQVARIRLAAAA
jgi:hypothetical protein